MNHIVLQGKCNLKWVITTNAQYLIDIHIIKRLSTPNTYYTESIKEFDKLQKRIVCIIIM